jgi:hypothetical protein
MVARGGSAPPASGCKPEMILFHHRAETDLPSRSSKGEGWLSRVDSHQDHRGQSPACCCYTTRQRNGQPSEALCHEGTSPPPCRVLEGVLSLRVDGLPARSEGRPAPGRAGLWGRLKRWLDCELEPRPESHPRSRGATARQAELTHEPSERIADNALGLENGSPSHGPSGRARLPADAPRASRVTALRASASVAKIGVMTSNATAYFPCNFSTP